jgi:hypothetical protein
VLAEDNHRIQTFNESAWARRYVNVEPEVALAAFLAGRAWNLALFRGLTKEDLAREAVHPDRGKETLDVIIRMLAGHDLNHLAQLERLQA